MTAVLLMAAGWLWRSAQARLAEAEQSQTYQRIAFWQLQPNASLIRQPTAPNFWGSFTFADYAWGQLWQAAWWRERMWFMPLAGRMTLLYYDKNAFREAGQPEPTIRWTWQEMVDDMTAVSHGSTAVNGALEWGF